MSVYVDDMNARFGRMIMNHLYADTLAELHAMANAIGVDNRWFQDKPGHPHYDIALSKKALAIKHGAIEVVYSSCHLAAFAGEGFNPRPASVEGYKKRLADGRATIPV